MNIDINEFAGYILYHKASNRMVMAKFNLTCKEYNDYMEALKLQDPKLYYSLLKVVKRNGYKNLRCYQVAKFIVDNNSETLEVVRNFNLPYMKMLNDLSNLEEFDELLSNEARLIIDNNDKMGLPKSEKEFERIIKQQNTVKKVKEVAPKKERAEARYITIAKYIVDKKCSLKDVCTEFNINMKQVDASLCNLKTKNRILYDNVITNARFD